MAALCAFFPKELYSFFRWPWQDKACWFSRVLFVEMSWLIPPTFAALFYLATLVRFPFFLLILFFGLPNFLFVFFFLRNSATVRHYAGVPELHSSRGFGCFILSIYEGFEWTNFLDKVFITMMLTVSADASRTGSYLSSPSRNLRCLRDFTFLVRVMFVLEISNAGQPRWHPC